FGKTSAGTLVASSLATRSEYFAATNDLYFYNNSGEILARVKNLSSHNYGCVDVILDRAGTGATAFWNNNAANRIMDKTFRIIPTNNNASGLYEITLYYSQAEVAGWEAATGQSFSSIQLIKTAGPTSAVTPASPNAAGTIDIVTPVRGTFGSNYTLTYTFNTGFSGFGAGIAGAALPITLLDFVGQIKQRNIVLDWKTSFESNSSGFDIERSYDGNNFTKIGFLKAAGNSSVVRSYTFTDREITQINNYYRLRQIDLDGKFTYSKVIVIKNPLSAQMPFTVLNNPVQSTIDIQFGETGEGTVEVRLTDVSGKLIKVWNGAKVANRRVRIDITDRKLSKGVYILHASVNGKEYSEKVIVK
ncbi:MAG TPA: T9SS type A sorting domain-containing protein, partial [Flavitalea sp.]|nr:T9SS type A sorting domain-containing protein [Flavitalea sp.]